MLNSVIFDLFSIALLSLPGKKLNGAIFRSFSPLPPHPSLDFFLTTPLPALGYDFGLHKIYRLL